MTNRPDRLRCYALLGLEPGATSDEIRAAFRREAKACHPDVPNGDAKRFGDVHACYETLLGGTRQRARGRHDEPALPELSPSEVIWTVTDPAVPQIATIRLSNTGGPMCEAPRIDHPQGEFWRLAGYRAVLAGNTFAELDVESVDLDGLAPGTHRDAMWVSIDGTYADIALTVTIGNRRPSEPAVFTARATSRSPDTRRKAWIGFVVLIFILVGIGSVIDAGNSSETLIRGGSIGSPYNVSPTGGLPSTSASTCAQADTLLCPKASPPGPVEPYVPCNDAHYRRLYRGLLKGAGLAVLCPKAPPPGRFETYLQPCDAHGRRILKDAGLVDICLRGSR